PSAKEAAANASQPGCVRPRLSRALPTVPLPILVAPRARPAATSSASPTAYALGEHQRLGSRSSSKRPARLSSADTVLTVSAPDERSVKNPSRRKRSLPSLRPVL